MTAPAWPQSRDWYTNEWGDAPFTSCDLDYFPTSLEECPACGALVGRHAEEKHKAWHLRAVTL